MRNLVITALLAVLSPAAAQTCPPATDSWGDPWPADAPIDAAEAEKIRCALIAALRSDRVDRLPSDLQHRVRTRPVGAAWSDQGRARIGTFWFESDGDEVVLRDTLAMTSRVRIGLVVRLRKRGARWVVTALNHSTAHVRRPTR